MKEQGNAVAIHGLRGRPSNLKFSPKAQRYAVAIPKPPEWADFGPAFAAAQSAQRRPIYVWRLRRPGFGVLVMDRPVARDSITMLHAPESLVGAVFSKAEPCLFASP